MINIKKTKAALKNLRIENKYTQLQLAELLDVSRQTIEVWESNNNIILPPLSRLDRIAEFYDVELNDIIVRIRRTKK